MTEEEGRYVRDDGAIVTEYPPKGRFVELWQRARATFTDSELHDLLPLIDNWRDENSTLVAYKNGDGEWVEIAPLPDAVPDDWKNEG